MSRTAIQSNLRREAKKTDTNDCAIKTAAAISNIRKRRGEYGVGCVHSIDHPFIGGVE